MSDFEPEWKGIFENWTKAYMKVHHWKIRNEMDFKDAVQEGGRIFAWCLRKTTSQGGKIDNEKWFMRYYQQAVSTWLIDAAAKATAQRNTLLALTQQQPISTTNQNGPMLVALSHDTSRELQDVLRVIMGTPSEFFLRLLLHPGPDNVWSRRMCRLCGIPINENIIGELRKLLKE